MRENYEWRKCNADGWVYYIDGERLKTRVLQGVADEKGEYYHLVSIFGTGQYVYLQR
jgi:hypothetical protein